MRKKKSLGINKRVEKAMRIKADVWGCICSQRICGERRSPSAHWSGFECKKKKSLLPSFTIKCKRETSARKAVHRGGPEELTSFALWSGSLRGTASEVAEQLVLLYPVHLRSLLLLFGVDLHFFFCCRGAQAHLGERVNHPAAFIVCQLGDIVNKNVGFLQLKNQRQHQRRTLVPTCVLFPRLLRVEYVEELPFMRELLEPFDIDGPSGDGAQQLVNR